MTEKKLNLFMINFYFLLKSSHFNKKQKNKNKAKANSIGLLTHAYDINTIVGRRKLR